jgi:hypothetical protein
MRRKQVGMAIAVVAICASSIAVGSTAAGAYPSNVTAYRTGSSQQNANAYFTGGYGTIQAKFVCTSGTYYGPTKYIGYTSTTASCIYYSVLSNSWVGTN